MTTPARILHFLLVALTCELCADGPSIYAQDSLTPAPDAKPKALALFTNVSKSVGLEGVQGKDGLFTDLDGDGWFDLVLDRKRLFRNDSGKAFTAIIDHGVPFPEIKYVPVGKDGTADMAKAKDRPYVPHYLYFADVDNDGDQDALWGMKPHWERFDGRSWNSIEGSDHGLRSQVLLNDGKGKFTAAKPSEYSSDAAVGPAMALTIVDTDLDGVLDLFEGRDYRQYGVLYGCGVDLLWKGDGVGGFTDVTKASGLLTVPEPAGDRSSRPSYGVTHADINNDGRPDLLQMAYGRQWNYLWLNRADRKFTEFGMESGFAGDDITHGKYPDWLKRQSPGRRDEQPFRSNGNTFDCAVADYDNDGDLDLFLGEITHFWAGASSDLPALLINQGEDGKYHFVRKTVVELLPKREFRGGAWNYGDMHVGWIDYDNDMLQDLLIASGDYPDGQFLRLYRQKADHSFEEVTKLAGFNWEGCGGLSLADFDRDGDVDILIGRSFARLNQKHRDTHLGGISVNEIGLFRNEVGQRNHWINVRLEGKGQGHANRSGLGARIEVVSGGVTQIRELRGGSGLANHQDAPEAAFGLAKNTSIDVLRVRWPDAKNSVQEFKDVMPDQFVTIVQGESKLRASR